MDPYQYSQARVLDEAVFAFANWVEGRTSTPDFRASLERWTKQGAISVTKAPRGCAQCGTKFAKRVESFVRDQGWGAKSRLTRR